MSDELTPEELEDVNATMSDILSGKYEYLDMEDKLIEFLESEKGNKFMESSWEKNKDTWENVDNKFFIMSEESAKKLFKGTSVRFVEANTSCLGEK